MSLIAASELSKTFGTHTLFTDVSFGLAPGDRLGLIGPNGAGKSTLLKILAALESPDTGDIVRRKQLNAAYIGQTERFDHEATPLKTVAQFLENHPSSGSGGLDTETQAAIALSKLGFDDLEKKVGTLSGGWRKRLSIACAIATEPDVLMLDEPTNHLDLEGVLWLEKFIHQLGPQMAVAFITHDRMFLDQVANRVVELSRAYPSGLFEVKGNYSEFVRRKEAFLEAQEAEQRALAGKVRRDTAWLKQGIQGRQTRNKTQVRDAADRREELSSVRSRNTATGRVTSIEFEATERKSHKLMEATGLAKTMGSKKLFDSVDVLLSPGVRLGLLGPNGSGKTTLLRILSQDLKPDAGKVKHAENLRLVRFTQHREALRMDIPLREALCPIGDTVHYRGKALHVASWAKKFLFEPAQFKTSVGDLSGGEQARILIADLMLKPADVLILDEPTNDLDIPSLEVLEESLVAFPGAIILVTHDRFMLERLATTFLALDGEGHGKAYVSLDQWREDQAAKTTSKPASTSNSTEKTKPKPQRKKLSFNEQRELDGMEEAILEAETRVEELNEKMADPDLIADHKAYAEVCEAMSDAQKRVQTLYARWEELETKIS